MYTTIKQVHITAFFFSGGHLNMKVVEEKVVLESDSFGDSDSDIPPPVMKKKKIVKVCNNITLARLLIDYYTYILEKT